MIPEDGTGQERLSVEDPRRVDIGANLARVRARIADACRAAGRDPGGVTLVAVTKTYPADDVVRLAGLGIRDIGENRDQEAGPKAREVAAAGADVRWHFVGQLQRNKVRSVVRYAYAVHSVDRLELVEALATATTAALEQGVRERHLEVLLQVNLDEDATATGGPGALTGPARGGVLPADLAALADLVATRPGLGLAGLMAVAPLGAEPEPAFARLAALAERIRAVHPGATALSAGMSGDLEAAITQGATHVRVGSALLGKRAVVR